MSKQISWLANVTFGRRHVMAVQHNGRTCPLITFILQVFQKIYNETLPIMHEYDLKIKCKYVYKR